MVTLIRSFLKLVKAIGLGVACLMAVYTTLALAQYVGETYEIEIIMRLIKTDYITEARGIFKTLYDNTLAYVVDAVKNLANEIGKL